MGLPESEFLKKYELDEGQNYCLHCGLCFSYCKRLNIRNEKVLCKECLFCYSNCPRLKPTLTKESESLGSYQKVWQVRSLKRPEGAQDAGVATLLAQYLLETGEVDAILLIKRDKDWHPVPFSTARIMDVKQASGSKFTVFPSLSSIKEGLSQYKRLAVVGLPCQLAALSNLQMNEQKFHNKGKVVFALGLFCMNSFIYDNRFLKGIKNVIETDMGLTIDRVEKIEISKGNFQVYASGIDGPFIKKVKDLKEHIWPVCLSCNDFTCVSSDISTGSIGSDAKANTVIIRTNAGKRIFDGFLKTKIVEAEAIEDVSGIKKMAEFKIGRKDNLSPEEKKFFTKSTILGNWLNYLNQHN